MKQVPPLRFSEFKEEWLKVKLGDLTRQMQSGISRKLSDKDIGYPIIRSNNLQGNLLDVSDIKYWYKEDDQGANLDNYILSENDLLVNFINSIAQIGKVARFENLLQRDTIFTTNLMRLSFKEKVVTKFVFYHFLLNGYNRYIYSITKPAVNQASFTTKDFQEYVLTVPTPPEQEKIASFLSTVDKKIQQLTAKKELLEQYKKGVMQKIFSQEIRFTDDNGKDYPDWQEKRGKDYFISHSNKKHNGDLPILAATQDRGMVHRNTIGIDIKSSVESVKSYKIVEPGDFVISLRSFQGGIEYSDVLGICSPVYIILKPKIEIDEQFFKSYFKKEDFITRLSKTVVGIRDGKQISYDAFSGLKMQIPTVKEQKRISNYLNSLQKKIDLISVQLDETQKFKKGLLQQLFI